MRDAKKLGVTYQQLLDACETATTDWETQTPYPGTLTQEEVDLHWDNNSWDIWESWADEVGYEFENIGTACCPETDVPDGFIFSFEENGIELS